MQIFSSDCVAKEELAAKMDQQDVVRNGDVAFRGPHKLPPVAKFTSGHGEEVDPEVRIPKSCSIIMNGHYDMDGAKQSRDELDQHEMCDSRCSDFIPHSNSATSTLLSSNVKESAVANSGDSESEGEPEISRHLLKDSDQEDDKPQRSMPKMPTFRTSPKKFADPHSHIQHRPLARYTSGTTASTQAPTTPTKWNWTVVKLICLVLFISFVAAVTCVIVGLFLTGPLPCDNSQSWWQNSIMYEMFPASYQDTDGDGFGDFQGIIQRLDHIKNLSVDVVRLNSIFSALDYPMEYEHVIDFTNVDPHLGRMEDFKEMVSQIHRRGMYVMLDLNPSVTSDQHTWAAHWLLHREGTFENFYYNISDKEEEFRSELRPPINGSGSVTPHRPFGGHMYLNWSNPLVQMEMLKMLEFWLQIGVDGFYMKHLENLKLARPQDIMQILHSWRQLLDSHSLNTSTKVLATSALTLETLHKICGSKTFATIPSLFHYVDFIVDFDPQKTLEASESVWKWRRWIVKFPSSPTIAWHLGSAETTRIATRVGEQNVLNCLFLLAVLPGSISVFYGDEVALQDSYDPETLKLYRCGQLVPMLWTTSPNGNFTPDNVHPWMPISPGQGRVGVESLDLSAEALGQLLAFKKISLHPIIPPKTTMMRSVINKFSPGEPDSPNYRWFHDSATSLVVLEVVYDPIHKFIYFANFGNQALKMRTLGSHQKGVHKWNDLEFSRMRVMHTSYTLQNQRNIDDIVLHGGQSIVCLYVT